MSRTADQCNWTGHSRMPLVRTRVLTSLIRVRVQVRSRGADQVTETSTVRIFPPLRNSQNQLVRTTCDQEYVKLNFSTYCVIHSNITPIQVQESPVVHEVDGQLLHRMCTLLHPSVIFRDIEPVSCIRWGPTLPIIPLAINFLRTSSPSGQ